MRLIAAMCGRDASFIYQLLDLHDLPSVTRANDVGEVRVISDNYYLRMQMHSNLMDHECCEKQAINYCCYYTLNNSNT